MLTVRATATVPTPGHRAPERHPAVVHVNVDSPIPHAYHPRVYANYVPAPSQSPARGTYRVPQRTKHAHPAPTAPLCGTYAAEFGRCTEPAGHVTSLGTSHACDSVRWFGPNEVRMAAIVWLQNHDCPVPEMFRNRTGL